MVIRQEVDLPDRGIISQPALVQTKGAREFSSEAVAHMGVLLGLLEAQTREQEVREFKATKLATTLGRIHALMHSAAGGAELALSNRRSFGAAAGFEIVQRVLHLIGRGESSDFGNTWRHTVQTAALRALSIACHSPPENMEHLRSAGLLPELISMLSSTSEDVRSDAALAVANSCGGNDENTGLAIGVLGALDPLILLLHSENEDCLDHALYALYALCGGSDVAREAHHRAIRHHPQAGPLLAVLAAMTNGRVAAQAVAVLESCGWLPVEWPGLRKEGWSLLPLPKRPDAVVFSDLISAVQHKGHNSVVPTLEYFCGWCGCRSRRLEPSAADAEAGRGFLVSFTLRPTFQAS
jgi:hypothetical protein